MRLHALSVTLAATALLVAGCGAGTTSSEQPSAARSSTGDTHSDHSDHDMSGMDMSDESGDGPSEPARMICTDEIAEAVKRTFELDAMPAGEDGWSAHDRTYSCRYDVPGGPLDLSVQDALDEKTGRAHYAALKRSLPGSANLTGMENFGFPAFATTAGDVVFLKDGKTLHVDATALDRADLPERFSRQDTAYSVASAVIACWTE